MAMRLEPFMFQWAAAQLLRSDAFAATLRYSYRLPDSCGCLADEHIAGELATVLAADERFQLPNDTILVRNCVIWKWRDSSFQMTQFWSGIVSHHSVMAKPGPTDEAKGRKRPTEPPNGVLSR